ncbi:MAG: hypothetical protein EZS28_030147, partial [Streblomastix strix]
MADNILEKLQKIKREQLKVEPLQHLLVPPPFTIPQLLLQPSQQILLNNPQKRRHKHQSKLNKLQRAGYVPLDPSGGINRHLLDCFLSTTISPYLIQRQEFYPNTYLQPTTEPNPLKEQGTDIYSSQRSQDSDVEIDDKERALNLAEQVCYKFDKLGKLISSTQWLALLKERQWDEEEKQKQKEKEKHQDEEQEKEQEQEQNQQLEQQSTKTLTEQYLA